MNDEATTDTTLADASPPKSETNSPSPTSPSPSPSSGELVKAADAEEIARVLLNAQRIAAENAARHAMAAPQRVRLDPHRYPAASTAEREAFEERMRQAEVNDRAGKALRACGVPTIYLKTDLWNLSGVHAGARSLYAAAVLQARAAIDHRPVIVALVGPRGPGKTTIACGLILETCREGRSARWLDVGDYFDFLKRTYGDNTRREEGDVENEWLRPDLLAIDKLETAANTPWEDQKLQRLIVKRYENARRTILVSNDTADGLRQRLGESVTDRLRDGGRVIVCKWPSLRGDATKVRPEPQ
jgi:DNA replication protein DnaC